VIAVAVAVTSQGAVPLPSSPASVMPSLGMAGPASDHAAALHTDPLVHSFDSTFVHREAEEGSCCDDGWRRCRDSISRDGPCYCRIRRGRPECDMSECGENTRRAAERALCDKAWKDKTSCSEACCLIRECPKDIVIPFPPIPL
jgi:hypothetical protein